MAHEKKMGGGSGILLGAVGVALVTLCVMGGLSARGELHPHMNVIPSEIRGVVVFSDGETPVTDFRVRVWDAEAERFVFKTRTNDDGVFRIPRLGDGRYYLIVGQLNVDLQIFQDPGTLQQQPHDIVIVIPRPLLVYRPFIPLTLIPFVRPPEKTQFVSP